MRNIIKNIIISWLIYSITSLVYADSKEQAPWLDFPRGNIETFAKIDAQEAQGINHLIALYHDIPKDQLRQIPERVSFLKQIATNLQSINQSQYNSANKTLDKLQAKALAKANYLKQLKYLHDHDAYAQAALYKLHLPNEKHSSKDRPLILVNRLLYDAKLPTFWGYYWLESIDPCHRQLTDYYLQWQRANTKTPFFMWLELQNVAYYTPSMHYFTDAELKASYVQVKNGLLMQNNKTLNLIEPAVHYLFVITTDQKMYVHPGSESIRHTSLSHGKPVLASGEIKVTEGKISFWNTESGHYQPTVNDAIQAAKLFNKMHMNLTDNCTASLYTDDGLASIPCTQVSDLQPIPVELPLEITTLENLL